MATIYPVIMSGGAGSRLWPLSRQSRPKQFLELVGNMTLLQETAARLKSAPASLSVAAPIVICGEGQETLTAAQLDEIGMPPSAIIIEPEGRNTAAVAAVAAHHVRSIDVDGLILLLPADHHMSDPDGFWTSVEKGLASAGSGELVTLGIKPTGPATGYGYIECGEPIAADVFKIARFVEKPELADATVFYEQGGFYWNAGIFLFRCDAMLREFETLAPDISATCRSALEATTLEGTVLRLAPEIFSACRAASIDVEIMQRTSRSAVVAPVEAGWSDIGSWKALCDVRLEESGAANTVQGDVLEIDNSGCLIRSEGPTVAVIGLTDVVVIATGDKVLVVHKDKAEAVKMLVARLKKEGRTDLV